MSDALSEQILEDARQQAEPIKKRARKEADEIVEKAQEEAEERKEDIFQQARERAKNEVQRLKARLDLEKANIERNAREDILDEIRDRVLQTLEDLRSNGDYEKALVELSCAAISRMTGRRFEVVMRDADREKLGDKIREAVRERAANELGRQVTINLADETISVVGGVVIQREDGSQICEQTFENRLDRLWPQLRQEVADVLFEQDKPEDDTEGT